MFHHSLHFIENFFRIFMHLSPVLTLICLVILFLGVLVGRIEGWPRGDAIYFALVTALTIGYGDMTPRTRRARIVAVLLGFCGIIFTGILVVIAIEALQQVYGDF